MSKNLKFLRMQDRKTQFTLHSRNVVRGKTNLNIWTRTGKRFGKLRKLATEEEARHLYNIEGGRQGA